MVILPVMIGAVESSARSIGGDGGLSVARWLGHWEDKRGLCLATYDPTRRSAAASL